MATRLSSDILPQPDDVTCGPTCLHAVYRCWGDDLPIERIISEVRPQQEAGTLAVLLAQHALERGYKATLWVYNLDIFDPTWFRNKVDVKAKLRDQMAAKSDDRLHFVSREYLRYLDLGGELHYEELNPELLRRLLEPGRPVLAGLSATYLYGCAREMDDGTRFLYDDVRGTSAGHFVVLYGYHLEIQVDLHLLEGLVPGGPALHPEVLVQERPVEALDEAVGLGPADPGGAVLDAFELEEELVGVPVGAPAEFAAVVRQDGPDPDAVLLDPHCTTRGCRALAHRLRYHVQR